MSLQQCPDCLKEYSLRAPSCIHCGAPNEHFQAVAQPVAAEKDDDNSVLGWILAIIVGVGTVLAMVPDLRVEVLRMFDPNTDVVTENEMRSCDSKGAKNQMKSAFDQSQYAMTLNLKAVTVQSTTLETESGNVLTCQAEMMLNNSETVHYIFNFTEQGDQYLISGRPS
ncbi:hypothetical protein [Acinetobacter sp.]|uniref:hypothetical protein n=1 Tax=Acinetobacter sp. TaxID=472 RepID=UPI00388F1581